MKKTLLSLAVIIVITVTMLFLMRDSIAKFAIETEGSKAWGAPVEITDIKLDLLNKTISLKNLNLANPEDPQSTLAKADKLHIEIIPESLLTKKIEIQFLEVTGLSLLSNLTIGNKDSSLERSTLALPNFKLPDPNSLIKAKKLAIKTEINSIKSEIDSIEDKWENKLDTLPNKDKLENYKARIERLKGKGDLFEKLAAAKDLENIYRELRRDLKKIKRLQADFKEDQKQLKEQISAARQLPQKYSREMVQTLGLDSSQLSKLASNALAGELKNTLQNMLSGIDLPGINEAQSGTLPYDIIVHQALVEGPIFEQVPGLALIANLKDLSYPLENANTATSINIEGGIGDSEGLQLISTLDHRDGINDTFEVSSSGLQLQEIALLEHSEISIELDRALLNMSGKLLLQGEEISGELVQNFNNSKFSTKLSPDASKAAKVIASILSSASDFGLSMNFMGTLSEPELSFKTSKLDKLISKAVTNQISREIERLQSDASHALGQHLDPQLSSLLEQIDKLNSVSRNLEDQKKNWRKLSK